METFWALSLGLSFSICAGMRAIAPLFIMALAHRLLPSLVPLGQSMEWLSATPSLLALGIAVFVELVVDKIPALDHLSDLAQTPLRSLSGALVLIAPLVELPGWVLALLFLIGGGSAFTVHSAKAAARAAATATTGGLLNPIISFLEDAITWICCLLALVLAPLVVILAILSVWWLCRRIRRAFSSKTANEKDAPA
jgi:uncharacterized membrane protein